MDELPIKSVVCFLEIKLDGHESRFDLPGFKTMQKLMNNNLVFNNPSTWYKGQLTRRDDLVEERSKLCNKKLGNDLVNYIAKAYRAKVVH